MNYYKRHLGDYARDTGHLTALEHGIYTLLLDWYYINECPIPSEKAKRIARGNPEETQTVLVEFFTLCDEGWRHARADREIAEYHDKAERNREAGKQGGRPRKTQTVSNGNPDITLATSHKPLEKQKKPAQARAPSCDLQAFLAECESLGEDPIPADDAVFAYAARIALPPEFVALAWAWFKARYAGKKQAGVRGWRQTFRNAVEGNWPKLWYADDAGGWALTTAGKQAQRAQS